MMFRILSLALISGLFFLFPLQAEMTQKPGMAKLCASCHQSDSNMMRGFLENIALKSKTLQMDLMGHKEVVKFNDHTELKNLNSFKEIRSYKGKGFRIHYVEKQGEKHAVLITRFDILRTIKPEDKLDHQAFKNYRQQAGVNVYDTRPPVKYQEAHIPGAKMLPAPAFDKFAKNLPEDKMTPVVFYCVGGCLSPTATMRARGLGYKNVKIYTGGFPEWTQKEFSVTTPVWLKKAVSGDIPHVLVDLRPKAEMEQGFILGAVSIPFAELASRKAEFPKQKNAPIVFYGPDREKAARLAVSWGYKAVRIFPQKFDQWQTAKNPVGLGVNSNRISYVPKPKPGTVNKADFEAIIAGKNPSALILDVRNPDEVSEGRFAMSRNIPVAELIHRVKEIPQDRELVLHCKSGVRAEMAHNLLKDAGIKSRFLNQTIKFKKDGSYKIL